MNNVDLAYCAGLFDGEGCININRHKPQTGKRSVQHTLRCHMGLSSENPVLHFVKSFGGSIKYRAIHLKNPKWKDQWVWTIESNQARDWLRIILPFLKMKREEALVAIEFQELRGGQRRGKVVGALEIAKRDWYYLKLKELK